MSRSLSGSAFGSSLAPFFPTFVTLVAAKSPKEQLRKARKKEDEQKHRKVTKVRPQKPPKMWPLSCKKPADVTTRSVHRCKGYPGIVPGLLRTPFSSILAPKTIHCTSVLTDAQPTRFPNKYMPSFPLSSFKTTLLPIRFETWQAHDVYLRSRCYDMSYTLYNMNHNIYYNIIYIYIICT